MHVRPNTADVRSPRDRVSFRACSSIVQAVIITLASSSLVHAQNSMIQVIKVANPAHTSSVVKVSGNLPKGVKPSDVLGIPEGMEVKFDAQTGVYCVRAEELMPAGGNKEFRIVMRDIWTIPGDRIEEIRKHTAKLVELMSKSARLSTAVEVRRQVEESLARLDDRQKKFGVGSGASPAVRIQSYEQNLALFNQALEDTGVLETQVRGEGIDLQKTLGPPPPAPEEKGERPAGDKPFMFKIRIHNPGRSEQKRSIKQYMPGEIAAEDIEPVEGLEVRYDSQRKACYLYSESVVIKPGDSVEYDIQVTNRWVILPERYASLESRITNVLGRAEFAKKDVVKAEARKELEKLVAARDTVWPTALNEAYIAFYHEQVAVVDEIDEAVRKLENLFQNVQEANIFNAPVLERFEAPSKSNTWLIVYIILGFLSLVSLLFFLRWYGKSKEEKL